MWNLLCCRLQGTYETSPGSSVSRIDIYADYLSSCSRLARVGILNATAFNRIIKYVNVSLIELVHALEAMQNDGTFLEQILK